MKGIVVYKIGPNRWSKPGPPAPKAGIIPLDHWAIPLTCCAKYISYTKNPNFRLQTAGGRGWFNALAPIIIIVDRATKSSRCRPKSTVSRHLVNAKDSLFLYLMIIASSSGMWYVLSAALHRLWTSHQASGVLRHELKERDHLNYKYTCLAWSKHSTWVCVVRGAYNGLQSIEHQKVQAHCMCRPWHNCVGYKHGCHSYLGLGKGQSRTAIDPWKCMLTCLCNIVVYRCLTRYL